MISNFLNENIECGTKYEVETTRWGEDEVLEDGKDRNRTINMEYRHLFFKLFP